MKRYLLFIAVFLFISCKDDFKVDGIATDRVGFVKDGQQVISAYNAQSELLFESPIYKSSVGNGQTMVNVSIDREGLDEYNEKNNTSLQILPSEYYTIENDEFQLKDDDINTMVKVKINVKKLSEIQGMQTQKYAIPLKLKTSGDVEVYAPRARLLLIPELTGGIRPNSEITLFSKTFEELGLNALEHGAGSFAVTSKYLFINVRAQDLRYYDRFTSEYVGSIPLSFKGNLTNFAISNDDNDNLLITNFKNTAATVQTIYRITGTGTPEKYIVASHPNLNGRKLSIAGDLDKNAIITATIENSSKVLYWIVKNGDLLSQAPQIFTADDTKIRWTTNADAVALGTALEDGLFISGVGAKSLLGYFSKDGQSVAEYDLLGGGLNPSSFLSQSLSYAKFNEVNYLALISQQGLVSTVTTLFDVTDVQNLELDPNSQKLIAYKGDVIGTNNNGNKTADVHLKVSDDKATMILYSFGTNGSIIATQFDSKSEEEIE